MSILNVCVLPDRVLVGTDTAAAVQDGNGGFIPGGRFHRTKAMVFDRCVVAGRGDVNLLACLWARLLGMSFEWDIERMRQLLEPNIKAAADYLRQMRGGVDPVERSEIVIAGLAEVYPAPRAYCATVELDGSVAVEEIRECMFAPGDGLGEVPAMETPMEMAAATQRQIEAFRATDPAAPIGGEFLVHVISFRGGVSAFRMGSVG